MPRPSDKALTSFAGLFGLLSDTTRLRLMLLLAAGERDVTSLCEELQTTPPALSYHLGLLQDNGLIAGKRSGRQILYALADNVKAAGGKLKISQSPYTVTVEDGERRA